MRAGRRSAAERVWPPWVQVESRELPAASLLGVLCLCTADGVQMLWTRRGLGVGSRPLLSDRELLIGVAAEFCHMLFPSLLR